MSNMFVGPVYASKRIGISVKNFMTVVDSGDIKVVRHGGNIYVSLNAIRDYIAQRDRKNSNQA